MPHSSTTKDQEVLAGRESNPPEPERSLAEPKTITRRMVNIAALLLMALMAALMITSAWNDTLTNDEAAHIGAGYAYLRKSDFRMNPEHPPLMKDLGALPLLFMKLHVDWKHKSWMEDPFGQWDFGPMLIFHSGRNPDTITQAAKAPLIAFTLALGWVIFFWMRQQFGAAAALLTLFLYAFSPTFLAHGRLVTTDVGAAAGYFIGTIAFLRFLKNPGWRNVALAGLAMGFALLTKFSTIALIPIALLLAVIWALAQSLPARRGLLRRRKLTGGVVVVAFRAPAQVSALWRYLSRTVGVLAIAFLTVYALYWHNMLKYPPARQRKDAEFNLTLYEVPPLPKRIILWSFDQPLLRPWAEYSLGLAATFRRSDKGNGPFFLGRIEETGQRLYFPFVYLVKEPLALHVLTLIALVFALTRIRVAEFDVGRLRAWLLAHFTEMAFWVVIATYWWAAIRSNLNIGVRHLLPTFPFIYILVAIGITRFYWRLAGRPAAMWAFRIVLGALLAWQASSLLRVHPSYLAYFNEIAGGPDGGWQYLGDSNLDWGQDLKRLAAFVEDRGIARIQLDYFGAADPGYYLKEKYQGRSSCMAPATGWVAVSAFAYTESRTKPECDYRRWLPIEKLAAKIGYSIFVFHLP